MGSFAFVWAFSVLYLNRDYLSCLCNSRNICKPKLSKLACYCVRPHVITQEPLNIFSRNLIRTFFMKICVSILIMVTIGKVQQQEFYVNTCADYILI